MAFIKTMTIDGFYSNEQAQQLSSIINSLPLVQNEFGKEVDNFNMIPADADNLFSSVLNKGVKLNEDQSGVFRRPDLFIHFEGFESPQEWMFVVAIEKSTFNIFEHQTGAKSALDNHQFNYRNLFEWDLTVNHLLEPGQGVFFRPWLFHAFDCGLIQTFRLREV